jgi:SAM-dependent methyltransferase
MKPSSVLVEGDCGSLVSPHVLRLDDAELLAACLKAYCIPSLAAWRAAELKTLRGFDFDPPVLEIGCGGGRFSSLLLSRIDVGIDLSGRELKMCRRDGRSFDGVLRMDVRSLGFKNGHFGTVFANCVVEHIPGLQGVLTECRRVLRPGGKFIATVPLKRMEEHLLLRGKQYVRSRAKKLAHVNVLDERGWEGELEAAGFRSVRTTTYLPGALCEKWDHIDGPICLGWGPCTVARMYNLCFAALPRQLKDRLERIWIGHFLPGLATDRSKEPCALALEAFK